MEKALQALAKMGLSEENSKKLAELLAESKKTGKVSSKKLIEALDAVDASEEQTEQYYDLLENNGVEIDVGDVLEILGPTPLDDAPTETELQSLEDEPLGDASEPLEEALPAEGAKLDDPVRMCAVVSGGQWNVRNAWRLPEDLWRLTDRCMQHFQEVRLIASHV